jgi:hypothetical protein
MPTKMIRRQVGPIEIWLPEDCVGDTLVLDRPDGMTDHEYAEEIALWQKVFGGLFNIVGEDPM